MKNRVIILIFSILLLLQISCKKEETPVTVHTGTMRVDYNIKSPLENPHLEFAFNNSYDLTNHNLFSIDLLAGTDATSLSLIVMLEDEIGNRTDRMPYSIPASSIIFDNSLHTYNYDFATNLGSSTSSSGNINIERVKKVIIFINAGISAKVGQGFFWIGQVKLQSK